MERKKAYRERQLQKGLVQVCVWVPTDQAGAVQLAATRLCEDRTLEVASLRSKTTGRLVK